MSMLVDGLYGYEIVLGALGVLLFVALLPMLLRQIWRDKPYGGLLAFFILPVAMIGFPSIKSIQYKDGVVSLEYVVVGAVVVAVVITVFQGTGANSLTGALSTGFGAIVTAMGAL